jgi:protein-ribulosamine 3-kinase
MIPEKVRDWLFDNQYGSIQSSKSVSGGCINNGLILITGSGITFFLKTNQNAPPDMFAREAEGLHALAVPDGPTVPKPYLHSANFILMQDLQPAGRRGDYWADFGRRLATLHNQTRAEFGFEHDNYIGSTPQPNSWTEDGYAFFAENRLKFQMRLATKNGLISRADAGRIDVLTNRLPELIPEQPASLIHGDLWSGNAMADEHGGPAIIDPAAHYGWAEADLAMTTLIGSFSDDFYQAYQEVRPLHPGVRERFPLYNLYHLLNHLNLFGRGYLSQVLGVVRRYL